MNILQKKNEIWINFAALWDVHEPKSFQLQGGFAPLTPTRGSAPGPRWGLCPQTPIIGSHSTRSPWDVPLPNNFSGSAPAWFTVVVSLVSFIADSSICTLICDFISFSSVQHLCCHFIQ